MTFDRLLAKSLPRDLELGESPPESVYLPPHLRDVHDAALRVLEATGDAQLRSLGLSPDDYRERFQRIVPLAAALHDLGKASDHFQRMLQTRDRQGLRHEWTTVLMLQEPSLHRWAASLLEDDTDRQIVFWAIAGHHPAYNRSSPPRLAVEGAGSEMRLLLGHTDFAECLTWLKSTFQSATSPPSLSDAVLQLVGPDNAFARIFRSHQQSAAIWRDMSDDEKRFVAAVKNCLVAADVAGSALPKNVSDPAKRRTWIADAFRQVPTSKELSAIIRDRLTDEKTGEVHELRPFQKQVAEGAETVTFVKAGCGTGKTLAAYHWARTCWPGRRLYFCYPTTGTATEGFRDYLVSGESPRFDAKLFHGRANVDLEILKVRRDSERDGDDEEAVTRIESLSAWSTPIVSCTVDTVLGLIQNNRRGLYSWPAFVNAAFIFDEIHAYDDKLFGALLRFVSALRGVPVLLMTASLPEYRFRALKQCMERQGRPLPVIPGPADLEERPRYFRQGPIDARDPLPEIRTEMQSKGKVLWICNTVDRVIDAAERAANLRPLIYHSRFRYEDRVKCHEEVIQAFKKPGSSLAICTQVAEMSLDLSATLLVTELATVPALIQRLGRLNRKAKSGSRPRPFIVIEPRDAAGTVAHLPYTPEDLETARRWLNALPDSDISQRNLADCWEDDKEAKDRRPAFVASAWIDGGPVTQVRELREASPGVTVILERDVPAARHNLRDLPRYALPMPPPPKYLKWKDWPDINGFPIAPENSISYDAQRGARWVKQNQ